MTYAGVPRSLQQRVKITPQPEPGQSPYKRHDLGRNLVPRTHQTQKGNLCDTNYQKKFRC